MARRKDLGRSGEGGARMMHFSGGGDGCSFFGFLEWLQDFYRKTTVLDGGDIGVDSWLHAYRRCPCSSGFGRP